MAITFSGIHGILNTKLILFIVFMLTFTYTTEAILFHDQIIGTQGNTANKDDFLPNINMKTLREFMEINFKIAKELKEDGTSDTLNENGNEYSAHLVELIQRVDLDTYADYNEYFYNLHEPWTTYGFISPYNEAKKEYGEYVKKFGMEFDRETGITKTMQKDIFAQILDILGAIPRGISMLFGFLTFTIADQYGNYLLPNEAIIFLNLFMIPFYTLLFIGLLPHLKDFAHLFIDFVRLLKPLG